MLKLKTRAGRGWTALGMTLLSLGAGACDSDPAGPGAEVPVAAVEMTPPEMDLVTGDTLTIQALPVAADSTPLTGRAVAWTSDDTLVAKVSGSGRITAVAAGITLVRARAGGVEGLSVVRVTDPAAEAPVITELSPASAAAGSGAFILTVKGGVYLPGSTVLWNGEARATTRVNPNELRAQIAAGDVADAGTAEVRVAHPPQGGGVSEGAAFQITAVAPAPAITSLSPAAVPAGSRGFTLVVKGRGIPDGVLASWGGTLRPAQWIGPGEVRLDVDVSDVWSTGAVPVALFHPVQGVVGSAVFTVAPSGIDHLQVEPAGLSLEAGDEGQLTARLLAPDGSELEGRHVTWSSTDARVVEVFGGGTYRAVAPGTARIRVASAEKITFVDVTVAPYPVAYLRVTTPAALLVGEEEQLEFTVHAAGGQVLEGRTVTWWSEAPGVAQVDARGVVTAISAGTARIWAEAEGKQASARVEVREWPQESPWTFDLRWDVGSVLLSAGDTTLIDAGGVERTSTLIVRRASLTVDLDAGTYEQEFRLTALGIEGEIVRIDRGRAFYTFIGDTMAFHSDTVEGYAFTGTYPRRGEILLKQAVGTAPEQFYTYVVR